MLQGELVDLDKKLNNKKNNNFSYGNKNIERKPKFDYTGTTNTTATTFARTRELKKSDFNQASFVSLKKTKTEKAPLKDEWDFNFFEDKKEKKKGKFADRFSQAIKKEKWVFDKEGQTKKKKRDGFAQKMANTMNRGKNIGNENEVVGQKNITKNMNFELEAEDAEFEKLYECQQCGRSFKRNALEKHQKVCKKVFKLKRKQYETQEHRVVSGANKKKIGSGKKKHKGKDGKNWKKKSEGLRNLIKKNAKKGKKKKDIEIEIVV